jgi:hypothetical protein
MSNKKRKAREIIARAMYMWCRGTESNAPEAQHGDSQTRFLNIQKCCNYEQLILYQFFDVFLVSFGTVWKYLTLTGTIWAQFYFKIPLLNLAYVSFFHFEIKF